MSVSASGRTGRVATSVSCFGGLGQPYRVKVWAVGGPNISPALVCVTVQCREEGRRALNATTCIPTPATLTTPTTVINIANRSGAQPSSIGNMHSQ